MELLQKCCVVVLLARCILSDVDDYLKSTGKTITVTTECGEFVGKRRDGYLWEDVLSKEVDWFLGIPYASSKRFEKPQPLSCKNEKVDATSFSSFCMQENVRAGEMASEDCLNLNIYSPVMDNSSLLPVMIYIHGGSYSIGKGRNFIGDNLAQHGVVVITINYRLSLFGFLSSNHPNLKGNYGLYDQIEALKWVQRHIKYFRGNPEKVTIFGNSAGGSSVGFQALFSESKGLFSQIIMQSGSPLAFWAFQDLNERDKDTYMREVAFHAKCRQESMEDIIECMKHVKLTSQDLKNIRQSVRPMSAVNAEFTPVLDGDLVKHRPADSTFQFDGPLMAGIVSREFELHFYAWFIFHDELKNRLQQGNHETRIRKEIGIDERLRASEFILTNHFANYTHEDADKIHHYYQLDDHNFFANYVDLLSDLFLGVPTLNFALKYQNSVGKKAYFYEFNHSASFITPGNFHEVELLFIFGYDFVELNKGKMVRISQGNDGNVSRYMMKLWTNFAKYGNPNEMSRTEKQTWEPLSDSLNCFILNDENSSTMVRDYKSKTLKFWKDMKKIKVRFPVRLSMSLVTATPNVLFIASAIIWNFIR